jgi:hypothetical protein
MAVSHHAGRQRQNYIGFSGFLSQYWREGYPES